MEQDNTGLIESGMSFVRNIFGNDEEEKKPLMTPAAQAPMMTPAAPAAPMSTAPTGVDLMVDAPMPLRLSPVQAPNPNAFAPTAPTAPNMAIPPNPLGGAPMGQDQQDPMELTTTSKKVQSDFQKGPDTKQAEALYASSLQKGIQTEQRKVALEQRLTEAIQQDPLLGKALADEQASWDLLSKSGADKYDALEKMLGMWDKREAKLKEARKQIDPNGFWNKKNTQQKVFTAIGIMLSGIGAGLSGKENKFLEYIDNQIKNDIAAQQYNSELAWKDAQSIGDTMDKEIAIRDQMVKSAYERYAASNEFVVKRIEALKGKFSSEKQRIEADKVISELQSKGADALLNAAKIGGKQVKRSVIEEMQTGYEAKAKSKENYWKVTDELTKRYESDKLVEGGKKTINNIQILRNIIDENNPVNDKQILTMLPKIVDPDSAVLLAEADVYRQTTSMWKKKISDINKAFTGSEFTDSQRENIKNAVNAFENGIYNGLDKTNQFYREQARKRGIDLRDIQFVEKSNAAQQLGSKMIKGK